jgi:hypothetical protein
VSPFPSHDQEGGGLYTFLDVEETVSIVSDDANDTSDGTGLRQLTLLGLNDSYNEISETVTLNGTTPVVTETKFLRVFRAFGVSAGSTGTNEGNIVGTSSSSSNTLFQVTADLGQTQLAIYTVPLGKVLEITSVDVTTFKQSAGAYEVRLMVRLFGCAWRLFGTFGVSGGGNLVKSYYPPLSIPQKSDIRMDAIVGANNTAVAASFSGFLRDVA